MKIISTIEEVQRHLPVAYTAAFERVDPFFANAEHNYIKYLIGVEQFNAFSEAYALAVAAKKVLDDEAVNDVFILDLIPDPIVREAIFLAQKTVVNLGYLTGIPSLSLTIDSSGIRVFSTTETKQAFKWQVDSFAASIRELGFNALEELLVFLEQNPDVFSLYINSKEYRKNEQFLIQSAAVFSENFNISASRYTFSMLGYLMKRVEDQVIKKTFGATFIDSLKTGDHTDQDKYLMDNFLVPGIALLTGAKAVVERIITFKNGVAAVNLDGQSDEDKSSSAATAAQVKEMAAQLNNDGSQFLQDGLSYINANIQDFPNYVVTPIRRRYSSPSDRSKGIFTP